MLTSSDFDVFIHLRCILWIPLNWAVILLRSAISTGYFPNSTRSSVTNRRFSPDIDPCQPERKSLHEWLAATFAAAPFCTACSGHGPSIIIQVPVTNLLGKRMSCSCQCRMRGSAKPSTKLQYNQLSRSTPRPQVPLRNCGSLQWPPANPMNGECRQFVGFVCL